MADGKYTVSNGKVYFTEMAHQLGNKWPDIVADYTIGTKDGKTILTIPTIFDISKSDTDYSYLEIKWGRAYIKIES